MGNKGRATWVLVGLVPLGGNREQLAGLVFDIGVQKKAEEARERLTRELEKRVNQRTAQLQAANRELEAFSYSVSHDLRAPLRAIDGFSAALVEDYYDQLDDQARDYLSRVRVGAQRMAELIDDLLALSRVSMRELEAEPVDLSSLARTVAEDLVASDASRDVEWRIADDLRGRGDPLLLRLLLENLLGNAWKFTSKRRSAVIEFRLGEENGHRPFVIVDNGAGFDMAYYDKLFKPFQRLHATADFPGTGIGLATANRIVGRHKGRIWAEAVPDQGATFYFTLDEEEEMT
jgi:light-regulated signal transduction histidine kinase (bacteriophytochrome)